MRFLGHWVVDTIHYPPQTLTFPKGYYKAYS